MNIIEALGDEITWTIFATDGTWYVTASHSGADDEEDNFKFCWSNDNLTLAIAYVAGQVMSEGPAWIKA